MSNCIFCKIVNGEIPCEKVFESNDYIAFKDINPQAPFHILIIPKIHLESFHLINNNDDQLIVKGLFDIAWQIIDQEKLDGCQIHINSGLKYGQEVPHIHLHLLSKGKIGLKM